VEGGKALRNLSSKPRQDRQHAQAPHPAKQQGLFILAS
jgi:hypothetical protein